MFGREQLRSRNSGSLARWCGLKMDLSVRSRTIVGRRSYKGTGRP